MSKEKKVKLTKAEKKAAKAEKKANKGKNPEVTKSIISAVTALVCVIAIVLTSVSITNKICSTNVEIAEKYSKNGGSASSDGLDDFFGDDDTSGEPVAPGTDAPVSADPGETPAADSNTATPNGGAASSTPTTPGQAPATNTGSKAPSTKADIINYYNTAINKAVTSKAGFSKTRVTTLGTLKGAEAIMKIPVARDAVNNFLGVGTKDYTTKKGTADNISKSALTDADVKQAKCTVSGNTYTITLLLADGNSSAPSVSDTSPLQRCGLFAGNGDKTAYDYKSANNVYIGLNGADNASVEKVVETTKNAKIVAKIDSTTGNITSLQAAFDWVADLTNVKYTIVKISGTGDAKTTVSFKNFVF